MTWDEIIKIGLTGLGGALVGGLINQGFQWLRDDRSANLHRQYAAIRVAVILEAFALECAKFITENDRHISSNGEDGASHTEMPQLIEYPKDLEWKLLDSDLLAQVLVLPNELIIGNRRIVSGDEAWGRGDEDLPQTMCSEECTTLGRRARQLASELRSKYKLPAFQAKSLSALDK